MTEPRKSAPFPFTVHRVDDNGVAAGDPLGGAQDEASAVVIACQLANILFRYQPDSTLQIGVFDLLDGTLIAYIGSQ